MKHSSAKNSEVVVEAEEGLAAAAVAATAAQEETAVAEEETAVMVRSDGPCQLSHLAPRVVARAVPCLQPLPATRTRPTLRRWRLPRWRRWVERRRRRSLHDCAWRTIVTMPCSAR